MKYCLFGLVVLPISSSDLHNCYKFNPFFQFLPLALVFLWWGIQLSWQPLENKGVRDIAQLMWRAQMQLFLFTVAGALIVLGGLHWAGRI